MNDFFINCDWGTSHFRLRAIRGRGTEIVAEYRSDEGAGRLAAAESSAAQSELFQGVLRRGLDHLRAKVGADVADAPVVISGMASSSIGWQELPYAKVPFGLDGAELICKELQLGGGKSRQRIVLVSGACTEADVMRGEETQALGVFQLPVAQALAERSLLILPGTHSKHLRVARGRVEGFRTFMTGELFEVLSKHSILRHSLDESPAGALEGKSLEAFGAGVDQVRDLPLSAALFRVRARAVLGGSGAETNRAFLSGVLIGSELAFLLHDDWREQPILLAAAEAIERPYRLAFEKLGLSDRLTSISAHDVERLSALGQQVLLVYLGF